MSETTPRVVVDVNILLNSITAPPGGLLNLFHTRFKQGHLRYLVSQELLDELTTVLSYPKVQSLGVSPSLAFTVAADLLQLGEYISPVPRYDWPSVPDPKDWYLLDLLFEARGDYLVTQDKALVRAAKQLGLPVLQPSSLRAASLLGN